MSGIILLLKNQFNLEIKSKQNIGSIFLFVFASTFLGYLAFKNFSDPLVWNGVFWLMILFASINATSNSFKESSGQNIYLYGLVSARQVIFSKIIFNAILLLAITGICLLFYSLFLGSFIQEHLLFYSCCTVGSLCLSTILTLSAGIANKVSSNGSLFNILSIPILIPVLILLIVASIGSLKSTEYNTFVHCEMYSNENHVVKATAITIDVNGHEFYDNEEKNRKIVPTQNFNPTPRKPYLLTLKYDVALNSYDLISSESFSESNLKPSWIKLLIILLVNLILILIAYLVFPKFWVE